MQCCQGHLTLLQDPEMMVVSSLIPLLPPAVAFARSSTQLRIVVTHPGTTGYHDVHFLTS